MRAGDKITLNLSGKLVEVTIISPSSDCDIHASIDSKTLISFKVANTSPPAKKPFLQSFFRVGPKQTKQGAWLGSLSE